MSAGSVGACVEDYTESVLSSIPDDFDGFILDVPVGTGVLTSQKYARLTKATILALDYSQGMLQQARKRHGQLGIRNVTLVRGDIGHLPIGDSTVDLCVSMNGLHAFPKKELALAEIHRVLKPEGKFIGCFYVTGKGRLTDFLVGTLLSRSGCFTEPFFSESGAVSLLEEGFRINSTGNKRSIFYFEASNRRHD